MFEQATRMKLRFATIRGDITTEQLWDVPLRSDDKFNLDVIARTASQILKDATQESFVDAEKANPAKTRLELQFNVIKHVIDVKLAEEDKAKKRAANNEEKKKLLAVLAEKQEGKMSQMSEKAIKDRIAALNDE